MSFINSAFNAISNYTPLGWTSPQSWLYHLIGKSDVSQGDWFSRILTGLSDSVFGTTYNQERLNERNIEANAAESQLNRDWQFKMLKYQNDYNSPSAMMQRFRDAGLNPALMMSGSAPVIESASPSGGSAASFGLSSAQHGNFSLSDMLLGAQARLMDSQAQKFDVESHVMKEKLPHEINQIEQTIKTLASSESLNNQLIDQSKVYSKVLGEQAEQIAIDNFVRSMTVHDEIKSIKSKGIIDATKASYIHDEIVASINSTREYTKLMRSNRFLNARLAGHYTAVDNYLSHASQQMDAMKNYYDKLGNNIKVQNIIGFIGAGAQALNAVGNIFGKILSRGASPSLSMPNSWDVSTPDYGF